MTPRAPQPPASAPSRTVWRPEPMATAALAQRLASDKAFRQRMYQAGRLRVQRTRLYALDHKDQWIHVANTEKPKHQQAPQ